MIPVRDTRTLFGGGALLLTGAILSAMTYLYFAEQYTGAAILKARWWWEIILNLQILSLACMWFCYTDRIDDPNPVVARQMRIRLVLSLFAVSVPTWIAILSASMGWFVKLPPKYIIDILFLSMVGFWLFAIIVPRIWKRLWSGSGQIGSALWVKPSNPLFLLPLLIAAIIFIADKFRGTEHYYLAVPFLFYAQAAVPYLQSGFGIKR